MLRSAHFSALAALALLPAAVWAQPGLTREGDRWVRTFSGSVPAVSRLWINGAGPVTLEGGVSGNLTYIVKVAIRARTGAEARASLAKSSVRLVPEGQWLVLSVPGGVALSTVTLKAPRLASAIIHTSDGAVQATGIDGPLEVSSQAGELLADRIRGECQLKTGGGNIRVGEVQGWLHAVTGAGRIVVKTVRGEAVLDTSGGDIDATEVGGLVHAQTGGGDIHIGSAGGPVNATSGGGQILVGKSAGVVTARNMAGPVQVGAAAGVRCESGNGGIRVSSISGPMRVSTSMGSIFASLLGSRLADSFLATGDGDITVLIPSNVGVTIRAENDMADTLRRIVSDFAALQPRRRGTAVVAEGKVNGGGPLLSISGTGGTIFIKQQ